MTSLEQRQAAMIRRWCRRSYQERWTRLPGWRELRALRLWKRRFYEVCAGLDPKTVRRAWRRLRKLSVASTPPNLVLVSSEVNNLERSLKRRRATWSRKHPFPWIWDYEDHDQYRADCHAAHIAYITIFAPKLSAALDKKFRIDKNGG